MLDDLLFLSRILSTLLEDTTDTSINEPIYILKPLSLLKTKLINHILYNNQYQYPNKVYHLFTCCLIQYYQ